MSELFTEVASIDYPIIDSDAHVEELRCDQPVVVVFRPLRFSGIEREAMAPLFTPAR